MFYQKIKRILDFLFALINIILLSPVWLIIILAIKLDSKGPVFFTQKRIGRNKKTFRIIKFRTMRTTAPKYCPTNLLKNPEEYFTGTGKFLRITSLDELPQLMNILKGQMSFIGPRPVIPDETDLIAERDKYKANDILPGLTGWAQINGRDKLSYADKALYDGEYVTKMSFFFDFKIFFLTIIKVLKSDGINEHGDKKYLKLTKDYTSDPIEIKEASNGSCEDR